MRSLIFRLAVLLTTIYALSGCHSSPSWKWKTHVGDTKDTSIIAPLGLGDDMIFVAASQPRPGRYPSNTYQFMQAFDKNTGYFLWHYQLGRNPDIGGCGVTQPVFDDGVVYVALECSNIEAVDTSTGQKLWVFPPLGEIKQGKPLFAYPHIEQCSTPVVTTNEVYFLCSYSDMSALRLGKEIGNTDILLALDRTSGYPLWEFLTPKSSGKIPIAVTQDKVFMVDGEGVLQAVDRKTGKGVWKFSTEFGVTSPPFAEHDQIFTASYYGRQLQIIILDEKTGSTKKEISIMVKEGRVDRVTGSKGVIFSIVNVYRIERSLKGYLYAIDAQSGDKIWKFSAGDRINPDSLILTDNTIYISTYNTLFALDRLTGKVKWRFKDKKGLVAPILVDDTIYIGDYKGYIYALSVDSN